MSDKQRNNYMTSMGRLVKSGKITSFPKYEDVMLYIGDKPDETTHSSYILSHRKDKDNTELSVQSFFWNRKLKESTIDDVYTIYEYRTSRQQVKKALQKLSDNEIGEVLSGKHILSFKTPYNKTEEIYKSYIGKTVGSFIIKDIWQIDRSSHDVKRSEYRYVLECSKCHSITTNRCKRILKNSGIYCPKCTWMLHKKPKNSGLYREDFDDSGWMCEMIKENTSSEYSRFSCDVEFLVGSYVDAENGNSDYSLEEFTEIFGTSYFRK